MVKIIETNLAIKDNCVTGHQSRVIEVTSWDDYIQEIIEKKVVGRTSVFGDFSGVTIPKMSTIENLDYDELRLRCTVILWDGKRTTKLAYLIKE